MNLSRIISITSLLVICLSLVWVTSAWATRHSLHGGTRFPENIRKTILRLADFPSKVKSVFEIINFRLPQSGVSNLYDHIKVLDNKSKPVSGFIIIPYCTPNGKSKVSLFSLANGTLKDIYEIKNYDSSMEYSDTLVGSESQRHSLVSSQNAIYSPLVKKNGKMFYLHSHNDLVAVDLLTGRILWMIKGAFHHSIELDSNGSIWTCGSIDSQTPTDERLNFGFRKFSFEDQVLVNISEDGKILASISVAKLISKSKLEHLLYGCSNPSQLVDPIHLNQVTPIKVDSGKLKKGQLLVSLRNMSTILLVDPVQQEVLWSQTGPWMNQHCVQVVGESKISVLDNHSFASSEEVQGYWLERDWSTSIKVCDIESREVSEAEVFDGTIKNFRIPRQGRAIALWNGGWLVEDSQCGTIFVFDDKKLVVKWSNVYPDRTVGATTWSRFATKDEIPDLLSN